jgi:pimeloyl-ACP methyl ester carboxylesterase
VDRDIRPVRQRSVDSGDIRIAISEYGDDANPSIILIHGISNRSDDWVSVIPRLLRRFKVLAMDLRGHGQSSQPVSGYHHADYVSDLQAVIMAYRLARPSIIGHSLGGIVALKWAVAHPATAAALVVEDSPLSVRPGTEATFATWLSLNRLPFEALLAAYATEHPQLPPEQVRRRAEAMAGTAPTVFHEELAAARAGVHTDHIAPLAVIRSPVLLIHGDPETGGMVTAAQARYFAATVPRSETVRLAGGSHHLHRDRREAFVSAVVPFLIEHGGPQHGAGAGPASQFAQRDPSVNPSGIQPG